jgi:hypothetical protein
MSSLLEQLADDVTAAIAKKYLWFSAPQKIEIKALIVHKFAPFVPEQAGLDFEDEAAHGKQRTKILDVLNSRGGRGATNVELSEIALRFGGRIHELRAARHVITCKQEGRGLYRYTLLR